MNDSDKNSSFRHVPSQMRSKPSEMLRGSHESMPKEMSSSYSPSQVNVQAGSDPHMPDHPLIRSDSMSDSELELENMDEYFLSEVHNDKVADKFMH